MMQRRATKQSRAANSAERRHAGVVAKMPCAACDCRPVELDHVAGSSAKIKVGLEIVLFGHWFILPLCPFCHARRPGGTLEQIYGVTIRDMWRKVLAASEVPMEVQVAVELWLSSRRRQ